MKLFTLTSFFASFLLGGCFGIGEMQDNIGETKDHVRLTKQAVEKTNERTAKANEQLDELIYKQTLAGLVASISKEGMSNIGVAAAQKLFNTVHEDSLYKYLATPYPVHHAFVKEGFPNVTIVGDPKLAKTYDHDPMSEHFYNVFRRAAWVTVRDLLKKGHDKSMKAPEFAEKRQIAIRISYVAPAVWGAKRLIEKEVEGETRVLLAPVNEEAQRKLLRSRLGKLAQLYQFPSAAVTDLELALEAKLQ